MLGTDSFNVDGTAWKACKPATFEDRTLVFGKFTPLRAFPVLQHRLVHLISLVALKQVAMG